VSLYLDSSAIVKLVVREPESTALRRYLRSDEARFSCGLARVEVVRAVRPHGARAVSRARAVLGRIDLLRLDDALLDAAARMDPSSLRSLDAIHLAAAMALGNDLAALVTYDVRMADAAAELAVPVASPS